MDRWPLVGRDRELSRLTAAVVAQRGAVISGVAGVGKTTLAKAGLRVAEKRGMSVARLAATWASRGLPFGALAPLLPPDPRGAGLDREDQGELLRRYGRAVAGRAGRRPLVVFVDDAHLLDDGSATLVHQLALTRAATVLVTVRSGEVAPPMRDSLIVAYRRGQTSMRRRIDGAWIREMLGPGDVSLLTRAVESHWMWPEDIEVVHVYLTHDEIADICRQIYERDVTDVELHDVVKADDPAIHRTAMLIANEAAQGGAGSRLIVDSLSCQLSVHILRRHAHVLLRDSGGADRLSFSQERAVREYIQEHLHENISLDDLAGSVGLSRYHFARRFRQSTGTTPHEFVLQQRVEHAKTLLNRTNTALLDIASVCGFADQSHLTREFRKRVSVTPGRYRAQSR